MLTGNTYVAPVPVLGEWQPWEPHVARLHLLEVSLRLRWSACYGDSVRCTLRGWWLIACTPPDHLCNNWMILFVLHDPGDCLDESITNALASDGNEHLFSIFFDEGWCENCVTSVVR